MLKKLTILCGFAFFVLLVGWAIMPVQAAPPGSCTPWPSCKTGGSDDGGDKYTAKVTFDDSGCGFCSDNGTPYVDGGDDLVAAGGDKFRFALTLQEGSSRSFFLDFSGNCQTPPNPCGAPPLLKDGMGLEYVGLTSGGHENVFSTGHLPEGGGFSLLDMVKGVPLDRNLSISFRDANTDSWVLSFNPDVCTSDWVIVTRTSATTWEFVPDTENGAIACLERRKNGTSGPLILQGTYDVPFKFTVERLLP